MGQTDGQTAALLNNLTIGQGIIIQMQSITYRLCIGIRSLCLVSGQDKPSDNFVLVKTDLSPYEIMPIII